jgi:hypothetical protein
MKYFFKEIINRLDAKNTALDLISLIQGQRWHNITFIANNIESKSTYVFEKPAGLARFRSKRTLSIYIEGRLIESNWEYKTDTRILLVDKIGYEPTCYLLPNNTHLLHLKQIAGNGEILLSKKDLTGSNITVINDTKNSSDKLDKECRNSNHSEKPKFDIKNKTQRKIIISNEIKKLQELNLSIKKKEQLLKDTTLLESLNLNEKEIIKQVANIDSQMKIIGEQIIDRLQSDNIFKWKKELTYLPKYQKLKGLRQNGSISEDILNESMNKITQEYIDEKSDEFERASSLFTSKGELTSLRFGKITLEKEISKHLFLVKNLRGKESIISAYSF